MQKLPNGVAAGAAEAGPEIVWPPRVVRPARPPALVYLDLNHYINLARTAAGLAAPDGYDGLLRAATAARRQDRAVFPLSGTHYVEMSGIQDPAQRTAVAEVMESLSGFRVLLGRVTIAELEIDAMIGALLGSDDLAQPAITATGGTSGPRTTSTTSTPSQSRCPTATLSSPTRRHATHSLRHASSDPSARSFPASLAS